MLNKTYFGIAERVDTIPHLALIEKKQRIFEYKETFERTNGYLSPAPKKIKVEKTYLLIQTK